MEGLVLSFRLETYNLGLLALGAGSTIAILGRIRMSFPPPLERLALLLILISMWLLMREIGIIKWTIWLRNSVNLESLLKGAEKVFLFVNLPPLFFPFKLTQF